MPVIENQTHGINASLEKYNMYCLDEFAYNPRDCLFDAFQVLLHYKYTSIELRECIIEHFKTCLQRNDNDALVSYEHELNAQSLMEMHNVTDPEIYLQRMTK